MIRGTHIGKDVGDGLDPLFVAVINLSPESFYKGSVAQEGEGIDEKIKTMVHYGVDCLDIGGMSTRPLDIYGGERASINQELDRINEYLPKVMDIASSYDLPVSIDTQYSEVARKAIDMGCTVVNDISGFKTDPNLANVISAHNLDVVLMATRNEPGDVCGMRETIDELENSIQVGLNAGIKREKMVIDPAFGGWQGRSPDCDLEIFRNFSQLKTLDLPIYIGLSRKSTIKTLNGGDSAEDRMVGSVIATNWLINHGAHIIRTHDIKETVLGYEVFKSLQKLPVNE